MPQPGQRGAQGPGRVVIRKSEDTGHAGHHGGAWKIAYADFVTAMMAFFLLMWLINATSQEQRRGLADYFSKAKIADAWDAGLDRVVAVTNPANTASMAVCRRIGMTHLGQSDAYYDTVCELFEARRP